MIWIFFFTIFVSCSIVAGAESCSQSIDLDTNAEVINPKVQVIEVGTVAMILPKNSQTGAVTGSETTSTGTGMPDDESVITGQESSSDDADTVAKSLVNNIPAVLFNFAVILSLLIIEGVFILLLYKRIE